MSEAGANRSRDSRGRFIKATSEPSTDDPCESLPEETTPSAEDTAPVDLVSRSLSELNNLFPLLIRVLAIGSLLAGFAGAVGHLAFGTCDGFGRQAAACRDGTGESPDWSDRATSAARWSAGGVAVFAGVVLVARKLDGPAV